MIDLKVVHLNTYDGNGGAGRACLRLNNALKANGIDSKVLVFYQFGDKTLTQTIAKDLFAKFRAIFNILAERTLSKWVSKKGNKTPFSIQWFGKKVHQHPLVKEADIIHIHWINHGFLTPKLLAKLKELEKPIVWTFHDSNAFTGGCHVRYDCENFHRQCGNCPQLSNSGKNDLSHRNWLQKEKAYSKINFQIIAPSQWMANSIKVSSLLGLRKKIVIPNTLKVDIFKPYKKDEAKKLLSIPAEKFVILTGFMPSKNDKHKGTSYLIEALEELAKRPEIENETIELVVFGNKDEKNIPKFPFKTSFLGTISKEEHLAKCYSAADVFVVPSLEDNLPNTVMEALSCATPVVAFKTGGIPDMVQHLENGYLAAYKNSSDLADGIQWLMLHKDNYELQKQCRLSVLENYSPEVIAHQHIALYEQIYKDQTF